MAEKNGLAVNVSPFHFYISTAFTVTTLSSSANASSELERFFSETNFWKEMDNPLRISSLISLDCSSYITIKICIGIYAVAVCGVKENEVYQVYICRKKLKKIWWNKIIVVYLYWKQNSNSYEDQHHQHHH